MIHGMCGWIFGNEVVGRICELTRNELRVGSTQLCISTNSSLNTIIIISHCVTHVIVFLILLCSLDLCDKTLVAKPISTKILDSLKSRKQTMVSIVVISLVLAYTIG